MISVKIILVYVVMLALFTCEWCEPGPTIQEQVDAFNETGWELFMESEFTAALNEFKEGLGLDPENISGNVGQGWSLLLLNSNDTITVVNSFKKGDASADWQNHSWSGLAVVRLNQEEYSAADSLAGLVLAADSGYIFTYREQIDWRDLLVIQAQARFITTDYDGAWQAIEPLLADTPTLEVGFPNGNLDPAVSSTWIVNGTTFALYEVALAEVIHILAEKYRLE